MGCLRVVMEMQLLGKVVGYYMQMSLMNCDWNRMAMKKGLSYCWIAALWMLWRVMVV